MANGIPEKASHYGTQVTPLRMQPVIIYWRPVTLLVIASIPWRTAASQTTYHEKLHVSIMVRKTLQITENSFHPFTREKNRKQPIIYYTLVALPRRQLVIL